MLIALLLFFLGLFALWGGAKWLVQGASDLAARYGIPSLLIGLTVVAWGTSAPEMGITLVGAWKGEGELITGNLVGSNIFNILLVLGLCATITPLFVKKQLIRWDVPVMVVSALFFWWVAGDKKIGRLEGALLLGGLTLYGIFTYLMVKKQPPEKERESSHSPLWKQIISITSGLALLALGSELLITNATKIARFLGLSELLIGLTLIAFSTSLPELVTSLVALRKKENDIAVGHIIGSNIFNLLGAMGTSALLSPLPIEIPEKALTFDIPIMVAVSIATLPIFLTGHRISRWEGVLFLFYYALYLALLVLQAQFSGYISYFTSALIFFIIPFSILTLFIGGLRHFKKG